MRGISVGWGDNYVPHLEGQEFEITTLPAGRYVLVHSVNRARDLRESDYGDNTASMAFDLSWPRGRKLPPRIDVVARCPGTATRPLRRRQPDPPTSLRTISQSRATTSALSARTESPPPQPRPDTVSSPGWTRTNNPSVNSRMLCQLSYRGSAAEL